jgi:hypothetical protein
MVKVKVLEPFVDIHTKNRHPVGEVFEATSERIAEICAVDPALIQIVSDETVVEAPKRKRKKAGEE